EQRCTVLCVALHRSPLVCVELPGFAEYLFGDEDRSDVVEQGPVLERREIVGSEAHLAAKPQREGDDTLGVAVRVDVPRLDRRRQDAQRGAKGEREREERRLELLVFPL